MSDSEKIYGLTNDFLFKAVFGQESNKKLTICLLNALLQLEGLKQIKEIEILNPFNIQNYKEDKRATIDASPYFLCLLTEDGYKDLRDEDEH